MKYKVKLSRQPNPKTTPIVEEQNMQTIANKVGKAFGAITAIITIGVVVAIPTAIVWGGIYATTLIIQQLIGG